MNSIVIGENIKKYRSFKGKKQEVLAKEIGVSRTMLSKYENGRVRLNIEILTAIAKSLNVQIAELLDN
jgi:transcriptional regulator with XRE-family HTH domain